MNWILPSFLFFIIIIFFMLNKPKRQETFALHMSYVYQKCHVFIILNWLNKWKYYDYEQFEITHQDSRT